MSDIIFVTNRKLCREDFFARIEKLAKARPAGIILREKDLTESQYESFAKRTLRICEKHGVKCILHGFVGVALRLGCANIHLPLCALRGLSREDKAAFSEIGASCHSAEDATLAESLGCAYITAGHVFDTECKAGTPGRGLDFLKEVCASVSIPVFAIGGISAENVGPARKAGAAGACVMSGAMTCADADEYISAFEER